MLAVRLWLCFCAALIAAGWLLGAAHCLTTAGYAVVLVAIAVAVGFAWRGRTRRLRWRRLRFRGLRGLRAGFGLLWLLTLLGALLHPLSTWDTLGYRLPRVCHWLAAGHWHWIAAPREWLNNRSPGYEFLMAPGIALHAYRFLWVPNFIAFSLLPAAAFVVLRQLGTPRRAAYCWAWLLPTAHVFLLQAASTSNDMMGLLFLLASIHFALRFRASGAAGDFSYAMISAGLLTALKLTNLPLLAVPLLLLLPAWRQVVRVVRVRPLVLAGTLALGALVSGLPIMVLNQVRYHDCSGLRGEPDLTGTEPGYAALGNTILIATQNLAPPVLPNPRWWSNRLLAHFPRPLHEGLDRNFERRFELWLSEVPNEGRSGLGLTIVLLVAWVALRRRERPADGTELRPARAVVAGGLLASGAYLVKAGATTAARLAAVHHSAVLAGALPLLHRRAPAVTRGKTWLRLCQLHLAVCIFAVIVHPFRPLLPVRALSSILPASIRESAYARRIVTAFEVVPGHLYAFDPLKPYLPAQTRALSAVLRDYDSEGQLWLRFSLRRLTHLLTAADLAAVRGRPGEVILAMPMEVQERFEMSLPQFAEATNAEVLGSATLHVSHSEDPREWFLLRVRQ